jgi:dipeptidyl aminopeptidase/acylaminoacyl peptidase
VTSGNVTNIVDRNASVVAELGSTALTPGEGPVRRIRLIAADGLTPIHGVMFLPSNFDAAGRYPLIDFIYPGPQVPQQPQTFRAANSAHARALAELGFAVVMLNTRGTPPASRALHQLGYGELLEPQLADHAAAMRQLPRLYSFLRCDGAGVLGQSGGGAAAARALFDYGDVFTVGVSVCGNHDSTDYAAIWSDKYRGPGERQAWSSQSNMAAAHKLEGKLLLASGDMDENVPVSQTLRLAEALIRAGKDFDLLIAPNEGHAVLLSSGYVQRRIWDYFVRHLLQQEPPSNFAVTLDPAERDRFLQQCAREHRE